MNEKDVSTALYGALRQLVTEKEYFYEGCNSYYSKLTERGQAVALELINLYAPQISEAIKKEALEQSKKLVFTTLKEAPSKDTF